jgi:hypothetical protein
MKSKDIAVIVLVAGISGILSLVLANTFFSNKDQLVTKVEQVDPINGNLDYIGKPYFSPEARPLNPTKDIVIDQNNNTKPLQ